MAESIHTNNEEEYTPPTPEMDAPPPLDLYGQLEQERANRLGREALDTAESVLKASQFHAENTFEKPWQYERMEPAAALAQEGSILSTFLTPDESRTMIATLSEVFQRPDIRSLVDDPTVPKDNRGRTLVPAGEGVTLQQSNPATSLDIHWG